MQESIVFLLSVQYRRKESSRSLSHLLMSFLLKKLVLANMNSRSHIYVIARPSVTFVRPTQAIKIFVNVSTPFGSLAIRDMCVKILRRLSQGTPAAGVKPKRGSKI